MTKHMKFKFTIAIACGAGIAWATWPMSGEIKVQNCSPAGTIAELSEAIHGKNFWRIQLADIREQLNKAENWDQLEAVREAQMAEELRKTNELINEIMVDIDKKYPRSAPTEADLLVGRLRDSADQVEHNQFKQLMSESMKKNVPVLKECENAILHHLSAYVTVQPSLFAGITFMLMV